MCPDVPRFLTLIVKSLSNLDLTTVHIGFLILEMIHILNNFNFYFIMKRFNLIGLLFAGLVTFTPNQALADIGGLTKCSDSPAFAKRLNASVKKLEQRISKYEANSPAALALQQQADRTKARFDKYGRSDLLCGTDGLPHLIADGRWSHAAEFILPGFGFIYITGWIGWVGRKYLRAVSTTKNPTESEIIINVPLALKIMTTGYIWPISAWQELISGELVATKDEITISPR
jgi:photosystem I subunit 3